MISHPVYIDYPMAIASRDPQANRVGRRHGHRWCHMWSDDVEALHAMARRIGMRREWFQDRPGFPHYDLVPTRRAAAIRLGAIEISLYEWLRSKRV